MNRKLLPEQVFYLEHRKKAILRRQIPWSNYLRELALLTRKPEVLPESLEEVAKRTYPAVPTFLTSFHSITGDYQQRKHGVSLLREERKERERKLSTIQRKLLEKQKFLTPKHTID